MNTNKVAVGLAVVAVLFGGWAVWRPATLVRDVIQQVPVQTVGAASPDFNSNYISVGGEHLFANGSKSFIQASTTLCAIQAPQSASTTLLMAGIDIQTATGTTQAVKIYKSTSQWVSTTLLAQDNLGSGVTGSIIASTTALNTKFGKNDWLVFTNVANSLPPQATAPAGHCSAVWMEI